MILFILIVVLINIIAASSLYEIQKYIRISIANIEYTVRPMRHGHAYRKGIATMEKTIRKHGYKRLPITTLLKDEDFSNLYFEICGRSSGYFSFFIVNRYFNQLQRTYLKEMK